METQAEHDLKTYLATALTEVCFGDEARFPLDQTIDRYFAPGYRQRTDGEEIDRDGFVHHIEVLRSRVASGRVEVLEVLAQGNRIADRHRVEVTRSDGSTSLIEVYLFGVLDDDRRLTWVDEVSLPLSGGTGDADLARAR